MSTTTPEVHADARRDHIAGRVRAIISELLGVEQDRLTDGTDLCLDLNADSLDRVEIALMLEEEFQSLYISDGDVEALTTVGKIVEYVAKNAA